MQGRVRHEAQSGTEPDGYRLLGNRCGATLIEYSMLVGAIAIVGVVGIAAIQTNVKETWQQVAEATRIQPVETAPSVPGELTVAQLPPPPAVVDPPSGLPAEPSFDQAVEQAVAALESGEDVDLLADIAPAAGGADAAVVQAPNWLVDRLIRIFTAEPRALGRQQVSRPPISLSANFWAIIILSTMAGLIYLGGRIHLRRDHANLAHERRLRRISGLTPALPPRRRIFR